MGLSLCCFSIRLGCVHVFLFFLILKALPHAVFPLPSFSLVFLLSIALSFSLGSCVKDPIVLQLGVLLFDCSFADGVLLWVQSLTFNASPLCPSLHVHHVFFSFSEDELRIVPWVFVISPMLLSSAPGVPIMTSIFLMFVLWVSWFWKE